MHVCVCRGRTGGHRPSARAVGGASRAGAGPPGRGRGLTSPPSPARYGGAPQSLTLKLPVTINKFFQPTEMAAQDFFQRWKQLSL